MVKKCDETLACDWDVKSMAKDTFKPKTIFAMCYTDIQVVNYVTKWGHNIGPNKMSYLWLISLQPKNQ